MMIDCNATTQKLILDFNCQNIFRDMQEGVGQIKILISLYNVTPRK